MFVFEIGPLLKEFCNSFTKGLGIRKNRGKCNWVFWREAISLSAQDSKGRGINITKWFLRKHFWFQHFCLLAQEEHQALRGSWKQALSYLCSAEQNQHFFWALPIIMGSFIFPFFIYFRGKKWLKCPNMSKRNEIHHVCLNSISLKFFELFWPFFMFTIRSRAFGHQLLKLVFTGKKKMECKVLIHANVQ